LPKELFLEEDYDKIRIEVLGNWYGTKQGPKLWNDRLDHILAIEMEMQRCPVDPCLYIKRINKDEYIFLCVHVDDGKIVSTRKEYIDEFVVHTLMKHVTKAKVLWQYSRFLGMDIEWVPEENQVF